jgi:hypothetical protein
MKGKALSSQRTPNFDEATTTIPSRISRFSRSADCLELLVSAGETPAAER